MSKKFATLPSTVSAACQNRSFEISGWKRHSSGHAYFCLKDTDAVIDAVAWRTTRLSLKPEDGMEVVCTGRLTT